MLGGATYVGYGQCRITGSDLASDVDNMATRLAKLEQIVELLTGQDVSADSLDQFSQSLGTVTDATLINAARGWSTDGTFSGVAISTLGWTMFNPCTGQDENFPVVIKNPDGSLNFGATTNGTLCGSSVDQWNNASGVGVYYTETLHASAYGNYTGFGNFNDTNFYDPNNLVTITNSGDNLLVNTSGFYFVTIAVDMGAVWGNDEATVAVSLDAASNANAYSPVGYGPAAQSGPTILMPLPIETGFTFSATRLWYIVSDPGNTLSLSYAASGTLSQFTIGSASVSFQLVKAV